MIERFTVSLEAELADEFNDYLQRLGSPNRSEAVRDLIREALARDKLATDPKVECVGVLSYQFDHHKRSLSKRLTQTHHSHHDLTLATLHVHLDATNCLETVVLKGKAKQVTEFGESIMKQSGVHHGLLHKVPFKSGA